MSGNQRLSDQLKFHWIKFILSFFILSKGLGINGLACAASVKREKGWGNSGTRGARGTQEEGARGIPRAPLRSRAPHFPHPFPILTRPINVLEVRSILQRKQWGLVNRPIPSSKNFHIQNQAKCKQELYKTFLEKMSVICLRIEKNFSCQWLRT